MGMSLKRERVKHLNHQTELDAPVIINIINIDYLNIYNLNIDNVKHLDHQTELDAPVIINIIIIV